MGKPQPLKMDDIVLPAPRAGVLGWLIGAAESWWLNVKASRSICKRLRSRDPSCLAAWWEHGVPDDVSSEVRRAVRDVGDWPNDLFLPEDSLDVLLETPFDCLGLPEFLAEIERKYGVTIDLASFGPTPLLADVARWITLAVDND